MPDLSPETPPSVAPGTKKSSDSANKPYVGEQTGNNSKAPVPAKDAQAATPADQPHDVTKPMGLADHIKALVGMSPGQQARIQPRNVEEAIDKAVSGVDPNKPGDGY